MMLQQVQVTDSPKNSILQPFYGMFFVSILAKSGSVIKGSLTAINIMKLEPFSHHFHLHSLMIQQVLLNVMLDWFPACNVAC